MTMMTESRKADRRSMAQALVTMAARAGYQGSYTEQDRRTTVELSFPHGLGMTVTFHGERGRDTYVVSWYGVDAGHQLNVAAFASVNPYHGHKATDVVHGFDGLTSLLGRRIRAITDGTAYCAA